MNTSQETTNLIKAMIAVAPEISSIGKSKQAYGYKYATLDSLIDMLRSVLPKHGLWFMQMPTRHDGKGFLTTRIFHDSGEWMEDSIEMTDTELQGKVNDTQKVGASITYFRRYALSAIFGVAADEDVDGNLNNVRQAPVTPPKPKTTKLNPMDFLKGDVKARTENGDDYHDVIKDYAEILKTDTVKDLEQFTEQEAKVVATEVYKRKRNVVG